MSNMTQAQAIQWDTAVLDWDQADRMRKALRIAGFKSRSMAEQLDVGERTVTRWLNGHTTPSRATLLQWALLTGVPADWLMTGECNTKVCKSGIPATVHVLPVRRPR